MVMLASLVTWSACDDDDKNNDEEPVLPATDDNFVEKAALANMTEVNFGQLAAEKGTDPMVREYGEHMVNEHTTAQDELEEIADDYRNIDWPDGLDPQHQQIREQLEDLTGYSFDSLYIVSQVMDHQMAVDLFETEVSDGEEQRVKSYASKYLPHIQHHLEKADSIRNVLLTTTTDDDEIGD